MRGNIIPCGIHPSLLLIHYLFVLCCTIFYLKVAIKYSYSNFIEFNLNVNCVKTITFVSVA